MKLKKIRRLLSALFALLIVVGSCLFTGSILVKNTLCSKRYMTGFFSAESIEQAGDKSFKQGIEVLSAKSNIPARVFEASANIDDDDVASAVEGFFDGGDTTLYNQARIELFEGLCTQYLEGNNIEYDENQVYLTAVEATKLFSQSYGLDNLEEASDFIESVNANYARFTSAGLMLIAVSIAVFFLIYSDKMKAVFATSSAFCATGFSYVLISLLSLIFGVGKTPLVFPLAYACAIVSSVRVAMLLLLVFGLIVSAISLAVSVKAVRQINGSSRRES